MQLAARKDISEGGLMWTTIRNKSETKPRKIVSNLKDYLIESPEFSLILSHNSTLRDKMEYSWDPGTYQCVTVGYYLLSYLPMSVYHIKFGGKGRGDILQRPHMMLLCIEESHDFCYILKITMLSSILNVIVH
jgi:hypothetical protein